MEALADRIRPYGATRGALGVRSGLWAALTTTESDAADPYPDPDPGVVEDLNGELARRALLGHLARLDAPGPGGSHTGDVVVDLDAYRLRRAS